jgi:hypothetical protein
MGERARLIGKKTESRKAKIQKTFCACEKMQKWKCVAYRKVKMVG